MKEKITIENQFKNAAEKSEQLSHPIKEAVWDRIETKLDTTILIQKKQTWKGLAIAALALFFISITAVFVQNSNSKSELEKNGIITDSVFEKILPETELVQQEIDTVKTKIPPISNKNILPNAVILLKNNISKDTVTAVATVEMEKQKGYFDAVEKLPSAKTAKKVTHFLTPKFEARLVQSAPSEIKTTPIAAETFQKTEQEPPLLIVNSKAVTGASGKKYKNVTDEKLNSIGAENLDEVVYLKEPLYVIDGKQYSEEEMYGENPTSPYAPLSEQEIVNVVVLRDNEATKAFGKKGEKGVLIITTKFGKPKPKPLLKSK
jgi:hypothetical protein